MGLRVFLLRKRSWRSVYVVFIERGWCADIRYWNRSPRMSSSSLSEEVVDRAICSRTSWGLSLAVAEGQAMHLPVDARSSYEGMISGMEMIHSTAIGLISLHTSFISFGFT